MAEPVNGTADTMSGSDALLWALGADPVLRPTIVALVVLASAPEWTEVRARIVGLTETVPRLRARAVTRFPGRGRPQFVEDDGFELRDHVRRLRLPQHAGTRDVLDLAQSMASGAFDAAVPLWEAVLAEDLEDGRSALLVKIHHAVIDGVGGLAVLAHLLDLADAPQRVLHEMSRDSPHSPARANETAASSPLRRGGDLARAVELVDDARDALFHPFRSINRLGSLGGSVARLMAPAGRPISPIMTGRGVRRHAEILNLDLDALTGAARAWSGTVNDVFVSSVVRGLTRYHEQRGVVSPGFRALMPINVRARGEEGGGNHFVPARFVIPFHADVAELVAEVQTQTRAWKQSPGLGVSDVLATGLSTLPAPVARGLWGAMLKGTDVCVTNIPGPPFPTTISGAAVEGIYAFAPPSGAALNVSLVSSAGRACIGITADARAIPDSAKLAACLEDGFTEVCSAPRAPA